MEKINKPPEEIESPAELLSVCELKAGVVQCELYHEDLYKWENPKADDYIKIPFHMGDTILIALCKECQKWIMQGEWILYYCLACHESFWINKEHAKLDYYGNNIVLQDGCERCADKVRNVFLLKIWKPEERSE